MEALHEVIVCIDSDAKTLNVQLSLGILIHLKNMSFSKLYDKNSHFKSSSGLSSRCYSPPARRHSRHKFQSEHCRCIAVFGLDSFTKEEKLREVFAQFGPIEHIQMVNFYQTQISRGFCFIYFETPDCARLAKYACHDMMIDGRRIRADFSISKREHSPTPGVYRGQPTCMGSSPWARNAGSKDAVLWSPKRENHSTESHNSKRRSYNHRY